jgi:metallo-beta-lactamase family protein
MKIHFWGATDDVTGSMTLLQLPGGKVLVDCGLAQGTPEVEKLNSLPFPFSPSELSAVIITHAHLDHSGQLPTLVKKGFRGQIYCTPPTAKLMRIILLDSAKLGDGEGPYNEEDVNQTLTLIKTHEWEEKFTVAGSVVSLFPAGHILGASSVMFRDQEKKIIFSGDLGRTNDPILPLRPSCPSGDVVIMESTYGGKIREGDLETELHSFLMTVSKESRVGIIASFAVARAQVLLTLIHEFFLRHPESRVRIVMDSPMMKEANKVYQQYAHLTTRQSAVFEALEEVDSIDFRGEWDSLKKKKGPLIVLSSSGMLTGGRISRHLFNWHEDEKAILYLPGYQGEGTPGRSLLEGSRSLKGPKGEEFIWQGEVWNSSAFSSHADQIELLEWAAGTSRTSRIYLLHGEAENKKTLKEKLLDIGFTHVEIPHRGESHEI